MHHVKVAFNIVTEYSMSIDKSAPDIIDVNDVETTCSSTDTA